MCTLKGEQSAPSGNFVWLCRGLSPSSRWSLYLPGLKEFVKLQGLLFQSWKWFGISSVQFSSLVTSLSRKFSSVWGTWAKWPHSGHSFPFISKSLFSLVCPPDWVCCQFIQFNSWTLLALVPTHRIVTNIHRIWLCWFQFSILLRGLY